jgi:hypothetical protein
MSTHEVPGNDAPGSASVARVDMKLEVIVGLRFNSLLAAPYSLSLRAVSGGSPILNVTL